MYVIIYFLGGLGNMYKRLAAEMTVKGITKKDLSILINKSVQKINRVFKGSSDFSYEEVQLIMRIYFKDKSVNYIFGEK